MRWMTWRAMTAPALAPGLAAVTAATSNSLKNYLALESIRAGGSLTTSTRPTLNLLPLLLHASV